MYVYMCVYIRVYVCVHVRMCMCVCVFVCIKLLLGPISKEVLSHGRQAGCSHLGSLQGLFECPSNTVTASPGVSHARGQRYDVIVTILQVKCHHSHGILSVTQSSPDPMWEGPHKVQLQEAQWGPSWNLGITAGVRNAWGRDDISHHRLEA